MSFFISVRIFAQAPPKKPETDGIYPLPVFYYSPETGFAFGAGLFYFHNPDTTNPDQKAHEISSYAVYTTKSQFMAGFEGLRYFADNKYKAASNLKFSRFPRKFFGVGPDSPESAEERLTDVEYRAKFEFQFLIADWIYVGPIYHFQKFEMKKIEPGGILDTGKINGSGGTVASGAGVAATWDKRNAEFYPTGGFWLKASAKLYRKEIGSSANYALFGVEYKKFVGFGGDFALGFHAEGSFSAGETPFQMKPPLGGENIMRGYYEGRFLDKNLLAAQAEFRFPLFWRLGGVVYASAGESFPSFDRISANWMRFAVGAGGRFLADKDRKLNLRIDVAVSEFGPQFYFNIKESF